MGLFDGLRKGTTASAPAQTTPAPKQEPAAPVEEVKKEAPPKRPEAEFVLEKTAHCPVCDKVFKTLSPKSGRVKRLESDNDLRPRCEGIDIMKYNVICCPQCGYTALTTGGYFESILPVHKKMIREQITPSFDPDSVAGMYPPECKEWDYDTAIDLHMRSLKNALVKNAKVSERAYNYLVLSWLLRGKAEELGDSPETTDQVAALQEREQDFYNQAYEGLTAAVSSENYPIAGMDQTTLDYLLATMSYRFGKLDVASKLLASILQSPSTSPKVKDKARDLKDEIIAAIKAGKK